MYLTNYKSFFLSFITSTKHQIINLLSTHFSLIFFPSTIFSLNLLSWSKRSRMVEETKRLVAMVNLLSFDRWSASSKPKKLETFDIVLLSKTQVLTLNSFFLLMLEYSSTLHHDQSYSLIIWVGVREMWLFEGYGFDDFFLNF